MPSFTIHEVDAALYRRLSDEARSRGRSKNALVKELLARSLGLSSTEAGDYDEFCGLWSEAERESFEAAASDHGSTDADVWA